MGFNIKNNYGPNIEVNAGGKVTLMQDKSGLWHTVDAEEANAEEAEIVEEVKASSNRGRPRKTGKLVQKSFIYRALTDEDTNQRLQFLYNGLKQLQWIASNTQQKNFLKIFSGEDTSSRVVWTGDINTLAELFRELVQRKKYVQLPSGESIWVMVNAHFWDNQGNKEFGNERLRMTHTPKDKMDYIEWLVRVMDPYQDLDELRAEMMGQR